tara:strand:- start:88 stop:429 length:342 start_codon:yes stop_codon:yes gene_type:complete
MIKVYKLTYLDRFTKCYKNIIALSRKPSEFNNFVTQLKEPKLSPFKTFDCCKTNHECIYAFYNKQMNEYYNYEELDKVINLIIDNGYKIDYDLTKIMIENKSFKDLIFYINKN